MADATDYVPDSAYFAAYAAARGYGDAFVAYRLEPERPTGTLVLLVHGWGGRAAQMGELIPPLLAAGATVIALDAPAKDGHDRREVAAGAVAARAARRAARQGAA